MNYRSFSDLQKCLLNNLDKIPRDIGLIVGIPRSGLLVANLLALYLELPFTDFDSFLEGRLLSVGRTRGKNTQRVTKTENRRVLVVDDSANTGATLEQVKDKISSSRIDKDIIYGAVYVTSEGKKNVDIYFEILPLPRIFDWNLFHHYHLRNCCVDIDGVLCRDPYPEENDDGKEYRKFIETVPPKIIPSREIGWIVTCRLEKYRSLTEEWLAKQGIKYQKLIMMDYPDMKTRKARGNHAEFKAEIFQKTSALLFIESSKFQAQKIANISGKAVFCVESWGMVPPTRPDSKIKYISYKLKLRYKYFKNKAKGFIKRLVSFR